MSGGKSVGPSNPAPRRIQRKRAKGWRMPENAVYVGRPSRWGNPFIIGRDGKRDECLKLYTLLAAGYICLSTKATPGEQKRAHRAMRDASKYLRGKDLACWCPLDKPCHADVLLKIAGAAHPPEEPLFAQQGI